jgi:hypothetical protein
MTQEETVEVPEKTRWAIAPDWFFRNNRSITALLKNYLCPDCAGRFSIEGKEKSAERLLATISHCCSHSPDFIHEKLPVLEGIFRLFLANGNVPATVEEISEQLKRLRGGNTYQNSTETLLRILEADMYYGLQETPD